MAILNSALVSLSVRFPVGPQHELGQRSPFHLTRLALRIEGGVVVQELRS